MCGIAGVINFDGAPVSRVFVKRMTDAIRHRGPDGEGQYLDGNLGLGHRRLSIIDLTDAASQPMLSDNERFVISYNGEVYNFRELRKELEEKGVHFHSRSDTEVVLKAYAHWGPASIERFNGMFAFAIWNRREKELLLARDRYGVKPLYYSDNGNRFQFASEIKALLANSNNRAEVNQQGLVEYLTFQNFFTDQTLYKGVKMLPAGNYIILRKNSRENYQPKQYWDYCFAEPAAPLSENEYIEELDRLFTQAVKRQLVSDVDVGTYLSGGIDSTAVTAIAAKELQPIKSFTCGFDLHSASGVELGYDERSIAEYMSYLFKTEHYEMVLKAGDMERSLPAVTRAIEEPRVGQSYPNYYAAQLASKFGKVVLSGTGGDELFGGYPWRYYRAVVSADFDDYADKYYNFWQRLIADRSANKVFAPIWSNVSHVNPKEIFRQVFDRQQMGLTRPEDYINHSLYFEAKTFLHGLLVIEDKLSMAHSLELRVPFLDNDLVDFAMKVPAGLKMGNLIKVVELNENEPGPKTQKYFHKTRDGKLIFRKAMMAHIPSEIVNGEKQGFSAPDASWFKGESIDYVRRTLFHAEPRIYEYLDRKVIQGLVNQHLNGKENKRLLIWSLLYFEEWLHQFA